MIYNIVFSALLGFFATGASHDIHISKCDIKHDTEESALQITAHIFIDDLELSMERSGENNLHILTEREREDVDLLLEKYLKDHLIISVDGVIVQPYYLGKEISDDLMAAWCYLEVTDVPYIGNMEITYDVLMELYADQRNIVTVKQDNIRKAYFLFDIKNTIDRVSFK